MSQKWAVVVVTATFYKVVMVVAAVERVQVLFRHRAGSRKRPGVGGGRRRHPATRVGQVAGLLLVVVKVGRRVVGS